MDLEPEPFNPFEHPTPDFLQDLFGKMPVAIIRITPQGIVLAMNPEAESVTGYISKQLIGKNIWATMFPGKLFQQVPKFISPAKINQVIRNQQMTLRTKEGAEYTMMFSRFVHHAQDGRDEIVLLAVDPPAELKAIASAPADDLLMPAPQKPAATTLPEGDFITPLAASPKKLTDHSTYRQTLRDTIERGRKLDRSLELVGRAADESAPDMLSAARAGDIKKLNDICPPDILHDMSRMQAEIHDLLALCRRVCD